MEFKKLTAKHCVIGFEFLSSFARDWLHILSINHLQFATKFHHIQMFWNDNEKSLAYVCLEVW